MLHLINSFLDIADTYLNGSAFIGLLLGSGLFFTIYLNCPQIRYFKRSIQLLLGKDKSAQMEGDTSAFQAVATSLASSIGAGSISGVAIAIHIGGPASIFWMWVNAFLGMATRIAETAASHRYREKSQTGGMVGGPMYFMKKKLNMHWLGIIFAVGALLTTFLAGNMPQVNGMTKLLHTQWGIDRTVTSLLITLLVAIVIIGGIKRISQVAEFLVPFMTFIYLALVTFVVIIHYDQILPSLRSMFLAPFHTTPLIGGFLGAGFQSLFQEGTIYGFFTNDAGTGSAAIAHCASKEPSSGKVAIMSMIEPFISTCFMCTLTALAIITTGSFHTKVAHDFDRIDIKVIEGDHTNDSHSLHQHMIGKKTLPLFTGEILVEEGIIETNDFTILHDRSIAENITIKKGENYFTGILHIYQGEIRSLPNGVIIRGKSILKDADLALYTFGNNPWGGLTSFLLILCFLLFAFSTVISYSYFGSRALIYLVGEKYLLPYRLLFVLCVFLGGTLEATIIWKAAILSCPMMGIPNLIGILLMRKDIKESIDKA